MNPLENLPELGNVWNDLGAFRSFLTDFHAKLKDPGQREALGTLMQRLDQQIEEAKKVVPGALEGLKKDVDRMKIETEADVREFDRRCKEVEAEIMARRHEVEPPPPAPPPAPPKVSENLAPTLAVELMRKLFGEAEDESQVSLTGSVAREWADETDAPSEVSTVEEATPSPKATQRPPAADSPRADPKPESKPPPEDDVWQGLSQMEE